jgi:syntaxin 16
VLSQLFRESETLVKSLGPAKQVLSDQSSQEDRARRNAQCSLIPKLQELSVVFRNKQKAFVHRIQGLDSGDDVLLDESNTGSALDAYDPALLNDQMLDSALATKRNEDIEQIASSMSELSNVFKELAVLVIDQGTILDRIDYNLEQTAGKSTAAVKELRKTEDMMKNSRSRLCILLLLMLIGLVCLLLVFKFTVVKAPRV